MSFYDDASFVFLAAGEAAKDTDDGGKLYNAKPAPDIISGGLQDLSTFTKAGVTNAANSITISDGVATYVGDGSEFTVLLKSNVFENSKNYRVDITVQLTSGQVKLQDGDSDENIGVVTTSGTHTFYFTSGTGSNDRTLRIGRRASSQAFNFTVSDVSVFEVAELPKDFAFVRGDDLNQSRIGEGGQVEVGRQNLLIHSNSFNETSGWYAMGSVTSGFEGYDGTNNAWKLDSTTNNQAVLEQTAVKNALVTGATGRVRTYSFYAKEGNVDGVVCRVSRVATPVQVEFYADLSNGTFRSGQNPGGDRLGSKIEDVGNGWYRLSITFKIQTTDVRIYAATLNESDQNTVNVGNNKFIYVQNVQLETGFGATSYIPTTSSSATVGVKEDEPRFNYPPMGGKPDLLIEPQRINRVKYSEYLDNSNWKLSAGNPPVTGVTVTHQAGKAPDGSNRALLVKEIAVNDEHQIRQVFPYDENTAYSHSFFAKPAGRTKIRLRYGTATISNHYADFTLVGTGTVSATAGNTTTNSSGLSVTNSGEGKASIEEHRDGWYRCKIENVIGQNLDTEDNHGDGSSTNSNFMFMKDNLVTYPGDTSLGMYLWGFQNEVGDYCSSYIPNHEAVATTTRTADAPTHLYTGISHGTDCSIFLEGKMLGQDSQTSLLTLSPNNTGDGTKRLLFFTDTSTDPTAGTHRIVVQNKSGTETVALYSTSGGLNIGETFKVVVNYSGTKMQAWINGEYMNSLSNMTGNNFHTITADDHFGRIDLSRDQAQNSHGISKILTFSDTMSRNDSEIITGTNYDTVSQMAEALTYDYHD